MRVLVVEDHPALGRSIAEGLRDDGYAVDLTASGVDADHRARHAPYDCVVLDVALPDLSGWEVLARLRRAGSPTPVLFLTARDAVEDRVKGLDLGADDYLVKPFAWEELLARVRSLIRRAHGKGRTELTVGDLTIDVARKVVSRAGRPIPLTAREFTLLRYLALRAGEVVSRTDIWDHLYDEADEAGSNVVDVYIGYLRAKIDKPFPTRLIHTRRGLGYVLSADTAGTAAAGGHEP